MKICNKCGEQDQDKFTPSAHTMCRSCVQARDRKKVKPKPGHIYGVVNKAWPQWVKVGRATNVEQRIMSYQTCSPYRDYEIAWSFPVDNMYEAERKVHRAMSPIALQNNEWYGISADRAHSLALTAMLLEDL